MRRHYVRSKPSVNFHARLDLDTEARRRRLQELTQLSGPRLVDEAFRALERALAADNLNNTATS